MVNVRKKEVGGRGREGRGPGVQEGGTHLEGKMQREGQRKRADAKARGHGGRGRGPGVEVQEGGTHLKGKTERGPKEEGRHKSERARWKRL